MAITLIANVKGHSAADADTFSTSGIDTSGADLLVVSVISDVAATLSDTFSNTWTLAVEESGFVKTQIYYAWNAGAKTGGGHQFTLTGTDIFGNLQAYAFSGSKTSATPLDQTNHNLAFSSTSVQPGSVTPTEDSELIVTILTHDNTDVPTINSSFTSPAGAGTGYGDPKGSFGFVGGVSAYLLQGAAAAVNPTWSGGTTNHYSAIATFKAGPVVNLSALSQRPKNQSNLRPAVFRPGLAR